MLPGNNFYRVNAKIGKCPLCSEDILRGEDMTVEKKKIHKKCFKCALCNVDLLPGFCSRDDSLEADYGFNLFCSNHMLLPPGKKAEQLDTLGKKKENKYRLK